MSFGRRSQHHASVRGRHPGLVASRSVGRTQEHDFDGDRRAVGLGVEFRDSRAVWIGHRGRANESSSATRRWSTNRCDQSSDIRAATSRDIRTPSEPFFRRCTDTSTLAGPDNQPIQISPMVTMRFA